MTAPQLTQYIQGQGSVTADGLNTFEQTCTNLAQLRAFIGVTGMQVYARGFTVPNDGGQGVFYWQAVVTEVDDNNNFIIPIGGNGGGWIRIGSSSLGLQTQTVLTSGISAVYNTPPLVRELRIRMMGGGGGASGTGLAVTDGNFGGDTVFNNVHAAGGDGGRIGGRPGEGGVNGAGAANFRLAGQAGFYPTLQFTAPNYYMTGGNGGGQGTTVIGITGIGGPGRNNTGAGGGAGAVTGTGSIASLQNIAPGYGGGQGEYVEFIIQNPASSYVYTIGLGGIAGSSSAPGSLSGNGGSGYIIVTEIY